MIKVGIIGIGFMGVTHFKALQEVEGARVTAICTRNQKKLDGDWRSIQGNFGDSGGLQDLSGIARYREIDDLLADDSIDLVNVCLPTDLHRPVSVAALQAGKHVLVEKPLALNLEDADAMIEAAKTADRLLMVGQVLRFFPAFAEAVAVAQSGRYGEIRSLHLKRVISQPTWSVDSHFEDVNKSGGPVLDLHIHDTDFIQHIVGTPQQVYSSGYIGESGTPLSINTQYLYGDRNIAVSAQSGAIAMPGMSFEHGYDLYLEQATLRYNNLCTGEEVQLATADGETKTYRPDRQDAFVAQLQHAVDCIREGRESAMISAENARTSLAICLQERHSLLTKSAVNVQA